MSQFKIVQGGMGVGVSGWPLARAVSRAGQLGVVSGTGLGIVMLRRLQCGDPGGHMRRALAHFPFPQVAQRVLEQYYIPGGKPADQPFKLSPMPQMEPSAAFIELVVVANFAEVYLAKEGHGGSVGINYLEKLQLPTLPSLYGAMLAGVDYVLMGAGIPRFIPGALDALAEGRTATLPIDIDGVEPMSDRTLHRFDPEKFCGGKTLPTKRPQFLAIISSSILAMTLARKSNGRVDGFIVEGASAGGHNAPPRGAMQFNARGEPIYGPRDLPDLEKIRELGLPYWMAGGFADPQKVHDAMASGAAGVQIGTAFAFCDESGIDPKIKKQTIRRIQGGDIDVFTDPLASPTGFPFKVMQVPGTLADKDVYAARARTCDLGYLRKAYLREDGQIGHRCAAEPVEDYLRKGGKESETVGRKCICNALFGTIGLAQIQQDHRLEPAIVTAGDDLSCVARLLKPGATSYTAADVIRYLLQSVERIPIRDNASAL
jgi:NAD(P)H-dependent flavin oxidoreductase YrpB (nitropropane dioxygenase family)